MQIVKLINALCQDFANIRDINRLYAICIMETLRADFLRYSLQHSWYKHIPIGGDDFYVYQDIGEQARNGFSPDIKDISGFHWHFFRYDKPKHIDSNTPIYKVRFGPFLQGVHLNPYGDKIRKDAFSLNLIMRCNEETFLPWIAENYPEMVRSWREWEFMSSSHPTVIRLFEKEQEKYWINLLDAIRNNNCVK